MDIFKYIKKLPGGQNRKKLIENTAIVIIIGIIILIAGSTLFRDGKTAARKEAVKDVKQTVSQGGEAVVSADDLEKRLRELLLQMKGVGKADVMITYCTSKENVPAYDVKKSSNSTEEKDSGGGTRHISEEQYDSTIVYEDSSNGAKQPVILKKIEPEIKGVLIVADGAGDAEVREQICNAVMVLLDVPAHKVQVAQRKK